MLPPESDREKLAEVALALLHLNAFEEYGTTRAWKSLNWDLTDLLYEKGWISNPKDKAKSVALTEEGAKLAAKLFAKHFAR